LISTVFSSAYDREKLDYNLIDNAFEGIQQQLYAQGKSSTCFNSSAEAKYTSEWERRIFKRIGNFLMQNNKSISECFDHIAASGTISIEDLQTALIRFKLNLNDTDLKKFIERLNVRKAGNITKNEFIQRFWSAYTYEETFLDENETPETKTTQAKIVVPAVDYMLSHNIVEASKKLKSELDEKVKRQKAFSSIQRKIKRTMPVQEAFMKLDTDSKGFLILRDFHLNFSNFFDLSLRNAEVRNLFQEIDSDSNGILLFEELDNWYKKDYVQELKRLEREKDQKNTQNEIFDHLIKILVQRGLTLQEVFEEIDVDKNNFIDVEEFHDLLERMGFTIT